MIHGLLWLPLLGVFFGLAGLGWYEWQKLQAYQRWAADYDQAKYDIRAVLALKHQTLTWGKPTRKGPQDLVSVELATIHAIQVLVDQHPLDLKPYAGLDSAEIANLNLPNGREIDLVLLADAPDRSHRIPFTDANLAVRWALYLQKQQNLPGGSEILVSGTPAPAVDS